MIQISEDKLGKYFGKAFKEVVLPVLEDISTKLTSVEDRLVNVEDRLVNVEDRLVNVETGTNSLNRKFDAQQDRLDRHGKIIDKLQGRPTTIIS